MSETLKACPFCGGKASIWYRPKDPIGSVISIHCERCRMDFSDVPRSEAIAAWNRRAVSWPDEETYRSAVKREFGMDAWDDAPGLISLSAWTYRWLKERVMGEK